MTIARVGASRQNSLRKRLGRASWWALRGLLVILAVWGPLLLLISIGLAASSWQVGVMAAAILLAMLFVVLAFRRWRLVIYYQEGLEGPLRYLQQASSPQEMVGPLSDVVEFLKGTGWQDRYLAMTVYVEADRLGNILDSLEKMLFEFNKIAGAGGSRTAFEFIRQNVQYNVKKILERDLAAELFFLKHFNIAFGWLLVGIAVYAAVPAVIFAFLFSL